MAIRRPAKRIHNTGKFQTSAGYILPNAINLKVNKRTTQFHEPLKHTPAGKIAAYIDMY
jgi:hypothetical protein